MADDQDFCLPGRKVPPRQPQPGEAIWQIRVNHVTWSCELRVHGEWGVEAQILRDGDLMIGRRFDLRSWAVSWADEQRHLIESGFQE